MLISLSIPKKIISSRKILNINENCSEGLVNVEETPFYMDIPASKTVDIKEKKI